MWKNWIPFRRKNKEENIPANHANGKENTAENTLPIQKQRDVDEGLSLKAAGGRPGFHTTESSHGGNDNNRLDPSSSEKSGHLSSRSVLNRTLPSNMSSKQKHDRGNQSFTAVHGPLLSTPIMPKVRRAIETNAGMRGSGRVSLLSQGKPVGRSLSLNYGPSNPAKSRAGQVPWVRLKRRESIGLADYISGRTPQSPNTVKLAPPELSGLPPAPSFRSTPLIVTTEANRSRMLDTQTVVCALREKRKRFGDTHGAESINEDISWHKSPKRRRQESSQSNASSVSIPPMPDNLPNLIATSGTSSMFHIEHLSNQRPSTIPAVDVFSNLHKPGLGGEQMPHQQVLVQTRDHRKSDLNNSRLAQKALQSSLSSSMRARNNLSLLERGGVDLKRIRNHSSLTRRASDASAYERNQEEPRSKAACLSSQTPTPSNGGSLEQTSTSPPSCSVNVPASAPPSSTPLISTVSAPTKRKIAEGVMLRKQNLSMNSPVQLLKAIPSNGMMSTSDFEKDKQKEYQRRVLDLLQAEDKETVSTAPTLKTPETSVTSVSTGPSLLTVSATTTPVCVLSSAATSVFIAASLDSLNKLVHSTSAAPPTLGTLATVSSATSNKPLVTSLLSATGVSSSSGFSFGSNLVTSASSQPLPSTSSAAPTSLATTPQTTATVAASIPASASGAGFSFGLQPPASVPASLTSSSLLSSGFQVNFGNIASSGPAAATSTVSSKSLNVTVPSSTSALSQNNSFNFGAPSSTSVAASQPGGFSFSANPASIASSGMSSVSLGNATSIPSAQTNTPAYPSTSVTPTIQFSGIQASSTNTLIGSSTASIAKPQVPAQTGGFSFGMAPSASTSGGFQFGAAPPQSSIATATPVSSTQPGGFSFGASQTASQPSAGGFNFSAQSVPTVTTAPKQSVFGAPASTVVSPSLAASGGFQSPASSILSSTSQPSAGGFAFNAAQPQPQPTAPVSANSMFTASATKPNMAGGVDFTQSTNPAPPPAYNFGANAVPKPSPFGTVTSSNAVGQNQGPFGTAASAPGNNVFGATASVSTANSGLFNFGAPASTATVTPSPFGTVTSSTSNPSMFGTATSTSVSKNLFGFGATATGTPASTGMFGSATNSPAVSQSPFGAANPTPFAATASKPSMFGAPASASSSVFSPASTQSVFGATPASTFSTNVSSTGFGSSASLATSPAFGSATAPTANQPFTFGAQPSSTSQPAATAFGSAAGSVFGGANPAASTTGGAASVFGSTASTGGSMFGATASTQPSVFGSSATPAVFGSTQAAPTFGSGQNMFGASNPSAPAFGAASTQQSTAPVFGSVAQTSQPSSTTPFGSTSVFGAPKPSANPFGAPASTTQSSGFVFAGSQSGQNTASPFGAPPPSTAPTGFDFGQPAAQPAVSPAGGFNFSAQTPTPAFAAPSPGGGFNFSAGAGTPSFNFSATPTTPNIPNMFTPQTPTGSVHRPRVAARRPTRRGKK